MKPLIHGIIILPTGRKSNPRFSSSNRFAAPSLLPGGNNRSGKGTHLRERTSERGSPAGFFAYSSGLTQLRNRRWPFSRAVFGSADFLPPGSRPVLLAASRQRRFPKSGEKPFQFSGGKPQSHGKSIPRGPGAAAPESLERGSQGKTIERFAPGLFLPPFASAKGGACAA